MSTIKSNSGKTYTVEGDYQSGYRLKDENGNKSVYSFDGPAEMKKHVNDVETGKQSDVGNFAKNAEIDDDHDFDDDDYDTQESLEEEFESGGCGVLASLTEDGYEYYRG